ncbi:MAG: GntR family transcriptional regulator [Microbacteriaceae bacterium]
MSDEAAMYVRNLIMSGKLRPGAFVRPEEIAEQLEISSTPAREGLQSLKVEGFLRLEPRHGFVVLPLDGQDIRDLFTAQALIAGELASRVALSISAEEVSMLETLQGQLIAAAKRGDLEAVEETNHAFHREINLLASSAKMSWVLGMLTRYVPGLFYSTIQGWPNASMYDHGAILRAFKAGDPDAARTAMSEHIMTSGELLATHFDEHQDDAAGRLPHLGSSSRRA